MLYKQIKERVIMDWDYLSNATLDDDWESNFSDYLDDEGSFHDSWDD